MKIQMFFSRSLLECLPRYWRYSLIILLCLFGVRAFSAESAKNIDVNNITSIKDYFFSEITDTKKQYIEPFQIFDNVYFVGINMVSSYVIKTSDGLILIDSLFYPYVEEIPEKMQALGLDPADIKLVIITHGHFDHAGGARYFQDKYQSQVMMTEAGYAFTQAHTEEMATEVLSSEKADPTTKGKYLIRGKDPFLFETPKQDLIAADRSSFTLGDTTIDLYLTPGHTPGTLSLGFNAIDGDKSHRAFVVGGIGAPFSGGLDAAKNYIESVEKIRKISQETPRVSVNLANHIKQNQLLERGSQLNDRSKQQPHPFVDADGFLEFLDKLTAIGEFSLKRENDKLLSQPLKSPAGRINTGN